MEDKDMNAVEVYCFRTGSHRGYFGFGLTAKAALAAAKEAGARAADVKTGKMMKLPAGVTHYAIDDLGYICWLGTRDAATVMVFDRKSRQWVDKEVK